MPNLSSKTKNKNLKIIHGFYVFLCAFCVSVLFVFFVLLTGCVKKTEENKNQNQRQQQVQNNGPAGLNENFEQASTSDLIIGQKVVVMGIANSDGSVVAERIMIGQSEKNFQNIQGFRRPTTTAELNDSQSPDDFQARRIEFNNGERPNFEQFQNLPDEQREQMREKMEEWRQTAGSSTDNRSGGLMKNAARLIGEVINKDEQSMTLKLDAGGSKLVFYSGDVQVLKSKQGE